MIFINSELNNFKNCIDFFKADKNNTYLKSATELSDTGNGNFCVQNDEVYMLSVENIQKFFLLNRIFDSREICIECMRKKCKNQFEHFVVDALYANFEYDIKMFYLIEFKNIDLFNKYEISDPGIRNMDKFLNKIEGSLGNAEFNELKTIFDNAKDTYVDEHSSRIKLKAYETVYSIMPHMYKEYCLKEDIEFNMLEFKRFLNENEIHYILVHNFDDSNKNELRDRLIKQLKCKKDAKNIKKIRDFNFDTIQIINGTKGFNELVKDIYVY